MPSPSETTENPLERGGFGAELVASLVRVSVPAGLPFARNDRLIELASGAEAAYLDTHDHRGRKKGCGALSEMTRLA